VRAPPRGVHDRTSVVGGARVVHLLAVVDRGAEVGDGGHLVERRGRPVQGDQTITVGHPVSLAVVVRGDVGHEGGDRRGGGEVFVGERWPERPRRRATRPVAHWVAIVLRSTIGIDVPHAVHHPVTLATGVSRNADGL